MSWIKDGTGSDVLVNDPKCGFGHGTRGTDSGGRQGQSEGGVFVPDKK